jgi:hypothetical protein
LERAKRRNGGRDTSPAAPTCAPLPTVRLTAGRHAGGFDIWLWTQASDRVRQVRQDLTLPYGLGAGIESDSEVGTGRPTRSVAGEAGLRV